MTLVACLDAHEPWVMDSRLGWVQPLSMMKARNIWSCHFLVYVYIHLYILPVWLVVCLVDWLFVCLCRRRRQLFHPQVQQSINQEEAQPNVDQPIHCNVDQPIHCYCSTSLKAMHCTTCKMDRAIVECFGPPHRTFYRHLASCFAHYLTAVFELPPCQR